MAGKFASLLRKSLSGQSLVRDSRGSEIAEAALVMPLTFMIMLGIFWFGQAFRIYGTIAHAARQGARAAAAQTCTTCTAGNTLGQNAINAVQTAMTAAHLDPAKASWPTTVPVLNSCVNGAAVPCDPASTNVCVQAAIQLSNTGTGAAGVCGVSVSFQYPYQFWFPGTSLNKQLLQLPGVARMSMEAR